MTVSSDRAAGALVGLAVGEVLAAGVPGWTDAVRDVVDVATLTAAGEAEAQAVAARLPGRTGHIPGPAAGLLRTTPLALANLGDDQSLVASATAVSRGSGGDPTAEEACVLWAIALDRAVREGRLDGAHEGASWLDEDEATAWTARLDAAVTNAPGHFADSESVVSVLQGALAAIWQTPTPTDQDDCVHLQHALDTVRRSGLQGVAGAVAGSLLGARWGVSAIPFAWQRLLYGGPGERPADLVRVAVLSASGGLGEESGWPADHQLADNPVAHHNNDPVAVPLPDDPELVAGNLAAIRDVEVDAVVSLCQVGCCELPGDVEHHHVLLIDAHGANPNCRFVLDQAVEALRVLRGEGKRVFVHCVGAASRTPSVVAGYLVRTHGLPPEKAIDRVSEVLFYPQHNLDFRDWLLSLSPGVGTVGEDR